MSPMTETVRRWFTWAMFLLAMGFLIAFAAVEDIFQPPEHASWPKLLLYYGVVLGLWLGVFVACGWICRFLSKDRDRGQSGQ